MPIALIAFLINEFFERVMQTSGDQYNKIFMIIWNFWEISCFLLLFWTASATFIRDEQNS